jgi:hypothetical protein
MFGDMNAASIPDNEKLKNIPDDLKKQAFP